MIMNETEEDLCPICISPIHRDSIILGCGHKYHNMCMKELVSYGYHTCSICSVAIPVVEEENMTQSIENNINRCTIRCYYNMCITLLNMCITLDVLLILALLTLQTSGDNSLLVEQVIFILCIVLVVLSVVFMRLLSVRCRRVICL